MSNKKDNFNLQKAINNKQEEKIDEIFYKVKDCTFLNVREKPTTDSKAITVLEKGAICSCIDNKNPDWAHIICPQGEGYCMKTYLELVSEDNEDIEE